MRMPLAPATLRAGGWISAGMISVVQMPLPMRAAIAGQRLAAALRAFARVADDLDDVLGNRPGWPRGAAGAGSIDGGFSGVRVGVSFMMVRAVSGGSGRAGSWRWARAARPASQARCTRA